MKLSTTISELTPGGDDGWHVYRRARAMVRAGEAVVELTIGEHDIRTDPRILNAMHAAALAGHTGYSDIQGIPALRRAVAERTQGLTGVATGPENIVITPGGQAALFAAHLAACNPGDRALYIDPYYATYPGTLRGAGAVNVPVPALPDQGFRPDLARLEQEAAKPGTASLLINTPNNPTGTVYGREVLEAIAGIVQTHDLWLISDEVYDAQVWDGAHLSPRALPGMEARTLVVGSLSKSHAMTGSRLGWICGPEEVVGHLTNLATHTTYGIPGYIQDAGLFALGLGPAFEAEIAAPFARRREITQRLLTAQQLVKAAPMGGGMYVMLDIRPTGLSGTEFAEALLEEKKIAVMPGESFGRVAAGHVRVAMTVEDGRYEEALRALLAFAAEKAGAA